MFCNKCGTQVPDGMPSCPKCGALMSAPTFSAASFNKDKLLATSKGFNFLGFIVWALAFISLLLPMAGYSYGSSSKYYNSFSLTLNAEFYDFNLMIITLPLMIAVLVLFLMKKDILASVVAVVNAIIEIVFFIILCAKLDDYGMKIGFGVILYLIFAILLVICAFVWPMIKKNMDMSKQNSAMMAQQQAMYQQQMYQQGGFQQPQQQAPQYQQPQQQAPQYQQPQQPQQ